MGARHHPHGSAGWRRAWCCIWDFASSGRKARPTCWRSSSPATAGCRSAREFVKTISAIISIATGASIGREGGITQLAATLSSKLGQVAKWPPYRLRLLVGCGAASGIAAAYNAPITGAVFAALIVLGNFSMNLFAPLVFASVVATMVSRSFFGIEPWYHVPPFPSATLAQLPWFVLLGRSLRRGGRGLFEMAAASARSNSAG